MCGVWGQEGGGGECPIGLVKQVEHSSWRGGVTSAGVEEDCVWYGGCRTLSAQSRTVSTTFSILKIPLTSLCLGFPVGATVPIGLTVSDKLGYTHSTQHSTWPRDDHGEIMGLGGLNRSI